MSSPIVEVEQGKLEGKVRKTTNGTQFFSFKGVPYAKPPLGELRFAVPQPPEPWGEVRDATKDCNVCAQLDRATNTVIGDEDCLYLNISTPKLPAAGSALLPVMVFFHGGGFVFGDGTDESRHGPDFLIEKDVIVVSLNYRLGILGFLTLDRKEAPGNMGLRDQVEALKWIQKNISNFGGDPGNVTIFGISAGGASVEYLVLSPMAKGLFHKAISMSGSSLLHWAQNSNGRELGSMVAAQKGETITNKDELLKYLKSLSTKDLITASISVLAAQKFKGGLHYAFVPTVEKPGDWEPFLDKPTYELLSKGEFTKVPYMSGFCTHEGLLMVSTGLPILENLVKEKDFVQHFPFGVHDAQKTEINNRLKSIYITEDNNFKESDSFGIDFFTDVDFLGGIYVATSQIAKNNSPVYFYEFSYDGSQNYLKLKLNITRKGACHGDDGGYIVKSSILPDDLSETDKLVRNRMLTMWTNFAKYGDPTPTTDDNIITTKWRNIADAGMACLQIDDKLTMKYDIYPERMKLYEELYERAHKS